MADKTKHEPVPPNIENAPTIEDAINDPIALMSDEVRIVNAETEIFEQVIVILQKYRLPESLANLVVKSVLLQITEAQMKYTMRASTPAADRK